MPNLIENGGVEEWIDGEAAPKGFGQESNQYSKLMKESSTIAEGKFAMRQVWSANDGLDSFWNQLHTVVNDIRPGRQYKLSFKAVNRSKNTLVVLVSAINSATEKTLAQRPPLARILVAPCDKFQEFSGVFSVTDAEPLSIIINVCCQTPDTDFPMEIVWDDWQLHY
ncbi:MAG: hypothetical protein K1Y02_03855 [Candidatus Hydrogenedentes bacterium]|nr:hypothetical protein [Candidatus Hydrogenedentota bacterium]